MAKTKSFYKKEVERHQFFQLPKWLFKPPYNKLSSNAKLMYSMLYNRLTLSLENDWYDKDGKIFQYFKNEDFCGALDCSEKTVIRAKKELANFRLLHEHRQGLSLPNRIYLYGPAIEKLVTGQELEKGQSRTGNLEVQELEKVQTNYTEKNKNELDNNIIVEEVEKVPYQEIIDHLNEKTGKRYSHKSKANRNLIKARWNEGYALEDFIKAIDNMVAVWTGTDYERYLQPSTLFRESNFDRYVNQTVKTAVLTTNVPKWAQEEYVPTPMTDEGRIRMEELKKKMMEGEKVKNGGG